MSGFAKIHPRIKFVFFLSFWQRIFRKNVLLKNVLIRNVVLCKKCLAKNCHAKKYHGHLDEVLSVFLVLQMPFY